MRGLVKDRHWSLVQPLSQSVPGTVPMSPPGSLRGLLATPEDQGPNGRGWGRPEPCAGGNMPCFILLDHRHAEHCRATSRTTHWSWSWSWSLSSPSHWLSTFTLSFKKITGRPPHSPPLLCVVASSHRGASGGVSGDCHWRKAAPPGPPLGPHSPASPSVLPGHTHRGCCACSVTLAMKANVTLWNDVSSNTVIHRCYTTFIQSCIIIRKLKPV